MAMKMSVLVINRTCRDYRITHMAVSDVQNEDSKD